MHSLQMPRKKQPPSLEDLTVKAVGTYVAAIGHRILVSSVSEGETGFLQANLDRLKEVFCANVPWFLFDKVAMQVLSSIGNVISNTDVHMINMTMFTYNANMVVQLCRVVFCPHLSHIEFLPWPPFIRHVLYTNLHKMNGLKYLNFGTDFKGWDTFGMEKQVACAVMLMKNLTHLFLQLFCTDHILSVVSVNCSKLQKLIVTRSQSVTDRSVSYLLNCRELKEIDLYCTSISIKGYVQLLMGLPRLEYCGSWDNFGNVLMHVKSLPEKCAPFGIRVFQGRDVSTFHLNLLVEMCPKITSISIKSKCKIERTIDLTVLAALDGLTNLQLARCNFSTDNVKRFLEMKGHNLTFLCLDHVLETDLSAVNQFCPNLKDVVFFHCHFVEDTVLSIEELAVPPFQNLERFKLCSPYTRTQFEFFLSNCFNIRCIILQCRTDTDDETMAKVMLRNPMKKLEELQCESRANLSMQTVNLLVAHCTSLRVLYGLKRWQGISGTEFADFRLLLKENNIDLDVK